MSPARLTCDLYELNSSANFFPKDRRRQLKAAVVIVKKREPTIHDPPNRWLQEKPKKQGA